MKTGPPFSMHIYPVFFFHQLSLFQNASSSACRNCPMERQKASFSLHASAVGPHFFCYPLHQGRTHSCFTTHFSASIIPMSVRAKSTHFLTKSENPQYSAQILSLKRKKRIICLTSAKKVTLSLGPTRRWSPDAGAVIAGKPDFCTAPAGVFSAVLVPRDGGQSRERSTNLQNPSPIFGPTKWYLSVSKKGNKMSKLTILILYLRSHPHITLLSGCQQLHMQIALFTCLGNF